MVRDHPSRSHDDLGECGAIDASVVPRRMSSARDAGRHCAASHCALNRRERGRCWNMQAPPLSCGSMTLSTHAGDAGPRVVAPARAPSSPRRLSRWNERAISYAWLLLAAVVLLGTQVPSVMWAFMN